jgi:hypothetical protein
MIGKHALEGNIRTIYNAAWQAQLAAGREYRNNGN